MYPWEQETGLDRDSHHLQLLGWRRTMEWPSLQSICTL